MLLKFYVYNASSPTFLNEFYSDTVPRMEESIKFGKKRYKVINVTYRMKGDGSGFLHARINLG